MVGFYHLTWCPDLLDHYNVASGNGRVDVKQPHKMIAHVVSQAVGEAVSKATSVAEGIEVREISGRLDSESHGYKKEHEEK